MKKILLTTFLFLLLFPIQVHAICEFSHIVPCGGEGTPCQFCHIFVLLNNIITLILTCLAPIIGGLMIIVAGVMFMFSYFSEAELLPAGQAGGPQLFSRAKKTITAVVVGIVIIFLSWVFLNSFLDAIGVADWTGLRLGWWKIDCPVSN